MSQWAVAKHFPGIPTPYMVGAVRYSAPTSTLQIPVSIAQTPASLGAGRANQLIGSRTYTLVTWVPQLTALNISSTDTAPFKRSGLSVGTFSNLSDNVGMADIVNGFSMTEAFGTQLDVVGKRGFVFNAELTLHVDSPEATLSGTVYLGQLPIHCYHGDTTEIPL